MINLYEKGRIPSEEKEILTKSFLIDKIANDMKSKYKKVFSFVNYDEFSLRNDIHFLISKYVSNNKKEINIKYIETTLLNKVREKYRRKSPVKVNQNMKKNNLIKVINSSSKKNIYLKKEENKEGKFMNKKLPVIKNKNNNQGFILPKINNKFSNYSKTYEDINPNEKNKLHELDNKINELEKEENIMKEEINKEKDEIQILEQYKKNIQKQIDEINKEIEKENESLQKEGLLNNNININNNINNTNVNDNQNSNEIKEEEFKEEYDWANNPSMSFDQMKYLERKKKIEEDCYNKENRYIFLKPRIPHENGNSKSFNNYNKRPFKLNNIKVSNHSMDNMRKIYLKNKNQEIAKEDSKKDNIRYRNNNNSNPSMKTIPYEDKIQLRILQRSLAQEKAFNHLSKLLSPEKQLLNESNYQGFNSNNNEDIYERKKKEYEIADKARKIQVEKMKKALEENIYEKEQRKKAEKEFDKKYREINEREYENYLERESQKKLLKNEKIQKYRKMLEEQIEQKKKIMLENKDEMEQPISLNIFSADNIK